MQLRPEIQKAAAKEEARRPTVQEKKSRQVIALYRARLEWLLRIPDLEPLYVKGLQILGLPGPRKGIGLRSALNALLLENKYTLICWAFRNFRHRFPAELARKIDRDFGLDHLRLLDLDEHLSLSQWTEFQEAFLFTLAREHRRYKQSQSILFYTYRGMVGKIVSRAVFDPGKHNDCAQEGYMALLHAIDKTEDSEQSMGAYAQMWIRRHVKNFLMGERFAVHVPINLAAKALSQESREKAEKAEEEQRNKGGEGRGGNDEGRSQAELIQQLCQPSISLNETSEESGPVSDHIPDEQAPSPRRQTTRKDLHSLVESLIGSLTDKQRQVLEMRYGLNGHAGGKTLAEVAREIGISHQQVSMRERRALQKLEDEFAPYMGEIFTA